MLINKRNFWATSNI